ncbi:MAG TPA: HAMP domain-containing sensor histidine kinase [Actinomycetospora sp.]|uniref:sensor histidine kinase n=1 Tax=Actinomycetospora sp. TaxID=1872135 RepID=UPI002F3EB55A
METVSAALAHDIGHELATVSFLVAAIRDDPALHPDNHRRLGLIEREVERLQELVGLRSDGVEDPEVSLPGLVTEIADTFALRGPAAVVTDPSPDVRLPVDARALWRLLSNIMHNAVRAAGPRGTVRLLVRPGPPVVVEVHDDGPGFGAGPSGHRGLGLEICRTLATGCGASVTFGRAAGGGTVARIRFRVSALTRGA